MLQQAWATGELIDELAATRQAFGYTGLAGSTPPLATGTQPTASTLQQPDDLLPRQPAPKTVQYQPPSFRLTRPTTRLTKNERIQVHHNYISAVSSLEHKKDLINRLKRSDTHNISAHEAEMSRHMTLHEDVLERILNILKQDDYYRTLEDLPVIDELMAYDDIKLFPELYDMSTIIERVTAEVDLIERQLRRPGMYPQHTDFSQPTSNLPKTTPNSQSTSTNNSRNSLPQSSLPCGQRTLAASTSSSDAPSSQTPPQTFTTSHQPQLPTNTQHTSPSPHKQHMNTPSKTNIDQSSQSSIAGEDQQHVPKSADGTRVKRSKQQPDSLMSAFAFTAICLVTLRETVPKFPIVLNVGQKDTHRTDVPTSHRGPDIHTQLANPETSRKGRTISHSSQAIPISVCGVQEITKLPTVCNRDGRWPNKLDSIKHMPLQNSAKEIKQFLGLTGYYRKFVPRFADISRPLTTLTKKDAKFEWTSACQKSFELLKEALCGEPVLKYADTSKPYTLYTDASKYGWAGVLTQPHITTIDDKSTTTNHPAAFVSGLFRGSQLNWAALMKEAFAIYMSIKKLLFYLTDAQILLRSDHKPLEKFLLKNTLNSKVNNWAMELEAFNIQFDYIKGSNNILADTLSCLISIDPDTPTMPEEPGYEFGYAIFEGREHWLHRPVLQMHHPHKHHPRRLQHHINHNSLQTHNTPHQARTNNI